MDWKKNGIGFNLNYIRENHKEIWDKYQDELTAGFPKIQELDHVYMNELVDHVDGKILLAFLNDCMPKELRGEMDGVKESDQYDVENSKRDV